MFFSSFSCAYESHSWLFIINPGANFTADVTFGRQRTQQQSSLNIKYSELDRITRWNQWRRHDCRNRHHGRYSSSIPTSSTASPSCSSRLRHTN
jgi:hypothetical protein